MLLMGVTEVAKRIAIKPGDVYNRLTVVKEAGRNKQGRQLWLCKCLCGNEIKITPHRLKTGLVKSCGCYRREVLSSNNSTHGLSKSSLYRVWRMMIQRCDNPKATRYYRYGGRGISYDPSFSSFEGFLAGIPDGHKPGLELDRINNDGNYEPGNLRWSTKREQSLNRSTTRKLTDPETGEVSTIAELALKYGLPYRVLQYRVSTGIDLSTALHTPIRAKNKLPSIKRVFEMSDKETKATISKEVLDLSKELESKISIDDEGVIAIAESAFNDSLPSNLREHVEPIQRHIALFNTSLLDATGKKALPVMKEKGLKRVSGSTNVGLDTTSVNITAPTGRKADGSMKDPVVTVISRRAEHADHGSVRQGIYDAYRSLND